MTSSETDESPVTGRRSSVSLWLLLIIVLALAARLAVVLVLGDGANPISGAFDQYSYDALAQRVAAGHSFSFPTAWYPFTQPDEPTAHWSYAYTLYLAVVYAAVGHYPIIARLIQVLLSAIGLWLTFRIGRRLFGERVGLAAAALAAFYAYFVFFAAALMTQTFYIIALLAAMDVTLQLIDRSRWRRWLALGLALGLATLLRQTVLIFAPLLLAWIWWRLRHTEDHAQSTDARALRSGGLQSSVAGPLLCLAVIALCVLPFTVYNYRTFNDFLLLNSNGGYWLYSSNHPDQGASFDGNYAAPLPEALRGLPEPAIDRALYRQGLQFIVDDPKRFLLLSMSRIGSYYWLLPSGASSLASNLGRVLSFTLYLPFMLYGLYLSRRRWRDCVPLYLYVGFDATLCLLTWAAPRYRLPSDALLMIFAGLAVVTLAERFGILKAAGQPAAVDGRASA
jgi:hypothetical protein